MGQDRCYPGASRKESKRIAIEGSSCLELISSSNQQRGDFPLLTFYFLICISAFRFPHALSDNEQIHRRDRIVRELINNAPAHFEWMPRLFLGFRLFNFESETTRTPKLRKVAFILVPFLSFILLLLAQLRIVNHFFHFEDGLTPKHVGAIILLPFSCAQTRPEAKRTSSKSSSRSCADVQLFFFLNSFL